MAGGVAEAFDWAGVHNLEKLDDGNYRVSGPDAFFEFKAFDPPVSTDRCYLSMAVTTPKAVDMALSWLRLADLPVRVRNFGFHVESNGSIVTKVIDLGELGAFKDKDILRLNVHAKVGTVMSVDCKLLTRDEVPNDVLPELVGFRCFTSKLHYLPGERIDYRVTMMARNYPDRESSKILTVKLVDDKGLCLMTDTQHYGFQILNHIKDLFGVFIPDKPLAPGKYRIEATSRDQRSGLVLTSTHEFGVQGKDDPYLYETPFKFVKDFSIIKGQDGLWHLFSITGDFVSTHEWFEDGQERTFSHGTSPDLRHWTYHEPVLSISNDKHPDGVGTFKDRNIWAPHVIRHGDTYYMFYTSVNNYTAQCISLATSKDLFSWKDYEKNPIVTFEGVDWAYWKRDGGCAGRDPVVLIDGDRFYMYVTADAKDGEERGVIAVLESDDLIHWKNPQIAVRGHIALESPQVWKSGETYYMVTSSYGSGTFTSRDPVKGWTRSEFPRTPLSGVEKYVKTSGGYAEEVVRLDDGSLLMAALTWRTWGNSIYFFKVKTDEGGRPVGYTSPW